MTTSRLLHYPMVVLVTALLVFPNLGTPSLWDIDEGLNAEAAREMLESGNWIVPTFNFQPRTAKPALLYWLQALAYQQFGVNEFSARLPSAVAAVLTALVVYELGRRMGDGVTGLLAAAMSASSVQICVLSHAATPDLLLVFSLTLSLAVFWFSYSAGSPLWLVTGGLTTGLAVLAKGPIGLALPVAVIGLYLLWQRDLRKLLDYRLLGGVLAFIVVAVPWYVLVASETRGAFLRAFWWNDNVNRFLSPMDRHAGPFWIYLPVMLVGFAPWSTWLVPSVWLGVIDRPQSGPSAGRFLVVWAAVVLAFFSAAATKLPNYVAPMYPALALLTARLLRRWQLGDLPIPRAWVPAGFALLIAVGGLTGLGLTIAGGSAFPHWIGGRVFPGLESWAVLGVLPAAGGLAGLLFRSRDRALTTAMACGTAFIALIAAFPALMVDRYKAAKPLAEAARMPWPGEEVRIGSFAYFRPSLVFYCRREVMRLDGEAAVRNLMGYPVRSFLICPAATWDNKLAPQVPTPNAVIARHYDMYCHCEIVVVTNRPDGARRESPPTDRAVCVPPDDSARSIAQLEP